MIIDTTYLLPLAKIDVDTDLLKATVEGRAGLKLDEITISLISLFELQAKAAKLAVPARFVTDATETILKAFEVEPFHKPQIIETSFEIHKYISDYIDCIIVATAVNLRDNLTTEDTRILANKKDIEEKYHIKITNHRDMLRK